jgi:hypothetical protein
MTYQATVVGRMLVCPRGRGDELSAADRRLLADLARQAGVAAQAVQATTALQRSRAELVSAREEERRRLRRDLHDGLGPTLAGVTMGIHAAGVFVSSDPSQTSRLLEGLEKQVEDAIADIRRLVYGACGLRRWTSSDWCGHCRCTRRGSRALRTASASPSTALRTAWARCQRRSRWPRTGS